MKTTSAWSGLAAVLAAALICPAAARAATVVPPATSLVTCTANDGSSIGDPSSCAVDNSTASVTTGPYVSLTASAAYGGGSPASSAGFAVLNYNFAVVGGTQDTVVPVDIDIALQQSAFNAGVSPAYGFAEVIVNTSLSSTNMVICTTSCANSANSFAGTLHVNAFADETGSNTITLEIEAISGGYADIPANSSSASADPRIYVDPGFANAGAYSIVLSDGIGNGIAPVPEPATLALMLGGLGFVASRVKAARRGTRG